MCGQEICGALSAQSPMRPLSLVRCYATEAGFEGEGGANACRDWVQAVCDVVASSHLATLFAEQIKWCDCVFVFIYRNVAKYQRSAAVIARSRVSTS